MEQFQSLELYCDEAGFTGNDLLEESQPYFVYAAVNFTKEEIELIQKEIYNRYPIQNGEIKGKRLVKSGNGQQLIKDLFRQYGKRVKFVYHDKKYALASKMVEYGIEPLLSSNYRFYIEGLNRYIAIGLYLSFITKDSTAEELFSHFLQVLRKKTSLSSEILGKHQPNDYVMEWFLSIIQKQPDKIVKSMTTGVVEIDKWIADLTTTSLFGLLSAWGQQGSIKSVICDDSKVFVGSPIVESFNKIGQINKKMKLFESEIGYDLQTPIQFGSSSEHGGLQIADLFSSVIYYCLIHREEAFSQEIFEMIDATPGMILHQWSMAPSLSSIQEELNEDKVIRFQRMMEAIRFEVLSS